MDDFSTPTEVDSPQPIGSEASSPMLTPAEARVLGCLLEKEISTPDYYPMTLNGLITACNQKSNRSPVTEWEEPVIEEALAGLRRKRLAKMVHASGARVPKFAHLLPDVLDQLKPAGRAVLTELMLRGAQSLAEIRSNSERLHKMGDLAEAEHVVQGLMNYHTGPLVKEFPAGSGRRTKTYAHLLCGEPDMARAHADAVTLAVEVPPPPDWKAETEARIAALEATVARLERILKDLGA